MKKRIYISAILSTIFLWPLFFNDFSVESSRLSQMNLCFEDKQIPCRWSPGTGFGYGSPLFNYLPPLPYYFGQLLYYYTGNLNFSTSVIYLVPLVISAFFIWAFLRFINTVNVSNMLYLAFCTAILLSSNNLLSAVFLTVSFIWVISYYLRVKSRKILIYSFTALISGVSLCAFYLIPLIFEGNLIHQKLFATSMDYLPIYASEYPKEVAREKLQILTGTSEVYDFNQRSNNFSFKTITKRHTIIRLSQHYFPNWQIFIDGKLTEFEYKNNSLGLMTIILGEGEHQISGRFFDTPLRIISNIISAVTFILMMIVFLYQNKFIKKWVAYYKKGIG
ncbi:hypothetical protein A3B45_03305 [Candidatus Daviesbacteria bacterium RIFCSPLOWO2_01_FULL_39_12]|uniref:Glycosyltransferase RgtA/B/C/D-like domain-containing protein n=1 Tax=Candidatus Daviesbacteria bacterium RIFCSPLOWO2_01_FULL_39_12 TaxID=1797785 RepID=A0A1F5KS87_9BACT|nr:MAG: hypothetical protein A3B45_03305 [Candidatus Daviesbacteria bacterium RIFCSPLOWO2_01_FULL_39_12]